MGKYYIYCSNNRAYHALINNSIMMNRVVQADFREDSASFFSCNYIFITKGLLSDELRNMGIVATYYPIIFELTIPESIIDIPVILGVQDTNGKLSVTSEVKLSQYEATEGCIGAFVLGEIPISYLSGIIFSNEEQMLSFRKSSPDLWFPEDLFRIQQVKDADNRINADLLKAVSEQADKTLTAQEYTAAAVTILKRIKMKAASYYAVEATEKWNVNTIRTNMDITLVRYLQGEKPDLLKAVETECSMLDNGSGKAFELFCNTQDAILSNDQGEINQALFSVISNTLLCKAPLREKVTEEEFQTIGRKCLAVGSEEEQQLLSAFKTIISFRGSNMDPDTALESLGKYSVLKAYMLFLDQQENPDFLKRACTKLNQYERRYAYIMFGLLNGMAEVDRSAKSNRAMERNLERRACEYYSDAHLINTVPELEYCPLINQTESSEYGIKPNFAVWLSCEAAQKKLQECKSEAVLEELYLIMSKNPKDSTVKAEAVYALAVPVTITVDIEGKKQQVFKITTKKQAKEFGKKMEKLLKDIPEVFDADAFRKYIADKKMFARLFRKHENEIQDLCRKA